MDWAVVGAGRALSGLEFRGGLLRDCHKVHLENSPDLSICQGNL